MVYIHWSFNLKRFEDYFFDFVLYNLTKYLFLVFLGILFYIIKVKKNIFIYLKFNFIKVIIKTNQNFLQTILCVALLPIFFPLIYILAKGFFYVVNNLTLDIGCSYNSFLKSLLLNILIDVYSFVFKFLYIFLFKCFFVLTFTSLL